MEVEWLGEEATELRMAAGVDKEAVAMTEREMRESRE